MRMQLFWRLIVYSLLLLAPAGWLRGQDAPDAFTARLRQLPPAVGANRTVTRQRGESWVALGIREHVGYQHLQWANGGPFASRGSLFIPGLRLAQHPLEDGLVLNLPELMVYRWKRGRVTTWYPVSVGMAITRWHTPIGSHRVALMEINPIFYWYDNVVIPPGPRNPLGDRWLGLELPQYGLHGTSDPTSIGRFVSHGCIRLFPPHIRALYDDARLGLPVEIVYETTLVGYADGVVYLACVKDIYGRGTATPASVRERLARFALDGAMPDAGPGHRLCREDGVARPLLGSAMPVIVDGRLAALPLGPTLRDDRNLLPVPVLAALLGADVREDGGVTFTRGERRYAPGSDAAPQFTALGARFVPVRAVVEGLGGTIRGTAAGLEIRLPPAR